MSASSTAALPVFRCSAQASSEVTRLLPTPPLPETTAITFFTSEKAFIGACRLWGPCREGQSTPQAEQLLLQSAII